MPPPPRPLSPFTSELVEQARRLRETAGEPARRGPLARDFTALDADVSRLSAAERRDGRTPPVALLNIVRDRLTRLEVTVTRVRLARLRGRR